MNGLNAAICPRLLMYISRLSNSRARWRFPKLLSCLFRNFLDPLPLYLLSPHDVIYTLGYHHLSVRAEYRQKEIAIELWASFRLVRAPRLCAPVMYVCVCERENVWWERRGKDLGAARIYIYLPSLNSVWLNDCANVWVFIFGLNENLIKRALRWVFSSYRPVWGTIIVHTPCRIYF